MDIIVERVLQISYNVPVRSFIFVNCIVQWNYRNLRKQSSFSLFNLKKSYFKFYKYTKTLYNYLCRILINQFPIIEDFYFKILLLVFVFYTIFHWRIESKHPFFQIQLTDLRHRLLFPDWHIEEKLLYFLKNRYFN
jgi:hypothetical protein